MERTDGGEMVHCEPKANPERRHLGPRRLLLRWRPFLADPVPAERRPTVSSAGVRSPHCTATTCATITRIVAVGVRCCANIVRKRRALNYNIAGARLCTPREQ